ncbi:MAG: efflux transporter, family, subunit [Chitinophagaceae bacterium]|nr:efflux transporter, family, subunit [Chitinophagaceae bacterium]
MKQAALLLVGFCCIAHRGCERVFTILAAPFRFLSGERKYIILFLYVPVMIVLQSCHSSKTESEKKPVAEMAATEVFIAHKGKLSSSLKLPGELIAFQQVDIYAKVNSFVKKLNVDVGSEVKAGQLLATMEAPEINSQLAGAESRLQSMEALYIASKANYDRLLETSKTPGTISPNDLDIALAKKNSDNAQLQSAKSAYKEIADNRNYLEIRAPFAGMITVKNVSAGAIVGPSGKGSDLPLFTLQQQKQLRLTVAVPEVYTSYLNDKSEVSFTVKSFPAQKFIARIKRLAGALDTRLRSERIEMDVDNKDKKLLPGMIAEITIPLPAKDSVFIVPKSAVVNSTEKVFIVKVENGKARRIFVEKGREVDGKIEVYGNLSVADTLLKNATEETRENSTVTNLKLSNQ